jgi:O-antigen/teichoic acid export membrane protein
MSIISRYIAKDDSRSGKVKKNIIGSIAVKGISIVVSFIIVPLTLGYVSSELYGVWLTLSSISVWLGFFDIGFTLGLKNRLTEALSIGDISKGKELVSTTYALLFLIFIPVCSLVLLLIPHIDWCSFLNVSTKYEYDIIRTMRVIVVCFSLQMILNIISTIFQSLQKVALSTLFPVIGNVVSLFLIYMSTLFISPSLMVLSMCISAAPIIVYLVISFISFKGQLKFLSPSIKYVDFSLFRDLFTLGAKFFIIQIQVVVFFQTTNFLISNISSPEIVSVYNVAYKYLSVATMLLTIIMNPFWPAFTEAKIKGDFQWMKNVYIKLQKMFLLFLIGIIIMVVLSPIAYKIWIGTRLYIPWEWTLLIAIYTIVNCWDSLHVYIINGLGVLKLQTYVVLIGIFVHIPFSYYLSHSVGAKGVVFSMTIIMGIYSILFTVQVKKYLKGRATGIWGK